MIKVLELFAGIGACSKALERLGIDHEIVDAVEIDKYAIKSFNAVHGTNFEPQDITKWDKDIECDLIMHGSPCQDFSVAGKQAGGDEGSGTRSSLMYETLRIVDKLKPKYVIWENVKNLLSKKHRHNFDAYIAYMQQLGYNSYYKVLNAKNYGVPQNRERVFTISIRNDGNFDSYFEFPGSIPLEKKLKDMLEDNVDERYYLSDTAVDKMRNSTFNQARARENKTDVCGTLCARDYKDPQVVRVGGLYDKDGEKHQAGSIYDKNGLCPTMSTMGGGNQQPIIVDDMYANREPRQYVETCPTLRSERSGLKVAEPIVYDDYNSNIRKDQDTVGTLTTNCGASAHRNGWKVIEPNLKTRLCNKLVEQKVVSGGEIVNHSYTNSKQRDTLKKYIETDNGIMPTMTTKPDILGYVEPSPIRIRKLTPKECWRFMGFDDSDFEKAEKVNSNAQLYKQAGNSIVVNVLESILKNLLQ